MMLRAALYARFSTEHQSAASVEDQLRICRELAAKQGAEVVAEFQDAAISGQAMKNRPGVRDLMAFARARKCDVVIAEHTDRLSRSLGGSGEIYDQLRFFGIRYVTVNQGEISAMHAGLSGTMSALFIEELGKKTRRGQEGVVLSGRAMGSLAYGYRVRVEHDAKGDRIPGLREIDPERAEVVRRIFRDYASGVSPWSLAEALNREGIPAPRGDTWERTTILGNPTRGLGILRNELYRGVRVWGRLAFMKNPDNGVRLATKGTGSVHRMEVPELRIVPEDLWNRAQLRLAETAVGPLGEGRGQRRPGYLLAGLVRCGACGGPMTRAGGGGNLRCNTRARKGASACGNTRAPSYMDLESRVLVGVQENLLHPLAIAEAVKAFNAAMAEDRRKAGDGRAPLERELADVERRAERLVREVEDGMPWSAVKGRHAQLLARAGEIRGQLGTPTAEVVRLPTGAAALYRDRIRMLRKSLESPHAQEARESVRALIEEVKFLPLAKRGCYDLDITADLAPLANIGAAETVRAGESRSRFLRSHMIPVRFRLAG